MTKVIGYTALHFGRPFLAYAIESIIDAVDQYIVLYSDHPSHNGGTATLANPDTEQQLRDIASTVAGRKLRWIKGDWRYENQQRESIYQYVPDADIILTLDSDELWSYKAVTTALHPSFMATVRHVRLPVLEYWRSFYRGFPDKLVWPQRIIYPKNPEGIAEARPDAFIHHFGYSQPVEYVAYKWSGGHGHQAEMRRDYDWVKDVYAVNRQTDCHPTTPGHWNAQDVNPWDNGLPEFMWSHKYAQMKVIE